MMTHSKLLQISILNIMTYFNYIQNHTAVHCHIKCKMLVKIGAKLKYAQLRQKAETLTARSKSNNVLRN